MVDGASASVAVGRREQLTQSVTYEAAVPVNMLGDCPQRTTGRYVRLRLTLPAGTAFNHLQGIDIGPDGVSPDASLR
jgi:hypothetical protein